MSSSAPDRNRRRRALSLSTDADESGVWSPDGLRIAWAGQRRKVMMRGAGAVLPEQTIATFDTPVQVWDWSRDGEIAADRPQEQRHAATICGSSRRSKAPRRSRTRPRRSIRPMARSRPTAARSPTRRTSRGSSIFTSMRFRSRARASASRPPAAPSRAGAATAASCISGAAPRFTRSARRIRRSDRRRDCSMRARPIRSPTTSAATDASCLNLPATAISAPPRPTRTTGPPPSLHCATE